MSRISGPLLDRIDIQVEVPAVNYRDLRSPAEGEPSAAIRERVIRAREMQLKRLKDAGIFCNARMSARLIKKFCKVDGTAETALAAAMSQFSSPPARTTRSSKLSRTIADLDGAEEISDRACDRGDTVPES